MRSLSDNGKYDGPDDARQERIDDEEADDDGAEGQQEEGDLLPEIFLDGVLCRLVKVHLHIGCSLVDSGCWLDGLIVPPPLLKSPKVFEGNDLGSDFLWVPVK